MGEDLRTVIPFQSSGGRTGARHDGG